MRMLNIDEVAEVSGGKFVTPGTMPIIQCPFTTPMIGSDVYPSDLPGVLGQSSISPFLAMLRDMGAYISFEEGSGDEVTITCKKPSSGADNDGGFGDCWLDKSGLVVGGLSAVALLLSVAYPPLAAVFGVLAGMVGVVTAFSCLVHVLGDFCWTKHNPLPG
jgi:hypothetical protein